MSDPMESLRAALEISPDNLPLRRLAADTLMRLCRWNEAEIEIRTALALSPQDGNLQVDLAKVFAQQQKDSAALAILESLVKDALAPARAFVELARLLLARGEVQNAVAYYKLGVEREPALAEEELAARLGVGEVYADSDVHDGRVRSMPEEQASSTDDVVERPKVMFSDIGGMDQLKEEIGLKIIHPMQHPEIYRAYGKPIGGGILLYGPPGCGKTHLARATAGEIQANFISVGISDVLDMWIGSSERNLRDLFENARANRPCVLFFDEVDALGAKRTDMRQAHGRMVINQFLSELDGIESSNEGILIMGATNSPWHLDAAFRRPGRFDRVLFVPPPDLTARAAILEICLRGKPCERIDYSAIARKTDQFSGADLKATVDLAVEGKLREAFKSGLPKPLTQADLLAAAAKQRPTSKEWFSTARNHALYANQGGIYDDVLKYLKLPPS